MRFITPWLFVFVFIFSGTQLIAQEDSTIQKGHLYVKVEDTSEIRLDSPNTALPDFDNIKQQFGVHNIQRPFTGLNGKLDRTYELQFSQTDQTSVLITQLEALNYIQYAERVPLHYKHHTPNDLHAEQGYLDQIEARGAWDESKGSSEVTIAVVDNAVFIDHEDLINTLWVNEAEKNGMEGVDDDLNGYTDDVHGYDVADDDPDPNPPGGTTEESAFVHGTHVAGLAAASTNNGKGMASLGYHCSIMSVKCSSDSSDGKTLPYAYDGVYYAVRNSADVINMSWGGPNMTLTGSNLFETAQSRGIVLIASAGNASTNEKNYPAAYEQVMAVGATDGNDNKAGYSNYGEWVDVMAPGSRLYSALAGTQSSYGKLSGTSMSAPLVSGLAGLILSTDTGKSKEEVENDITDGAENIDDQNSQYAGQLGSGRINAYKSLVETTYVEPPAESAKINVYPNPASDNLNVRVFQSLKQPLHLMVVDIQGKVVHQENRFIHRQNEEKTLTLPQLKPGIYQVVLWNQGDRLEKQVMLE